jgi:hypothetical protein
MTYYRLKCSSRSFQGNQLGEAILFFDSINISKEENIIPASIPAIAILTVGKKLSYQ